MNHGERLKTGSRFPIHACCCCTLYWLWVFLYLSIYWFLYSTANFICTSTKLDGFIRVHKYTLPHTNSKYIRIDWFVAGFAARFPFLFIIILILCWFFQGTRYDKRYPIAILMTLGIFGAFVGLFLPETLHQKLPDSMQEAREFGANQVMIFFFALFAFSNRFDWIIINI